jgi:hypothetical protein
MLSHLREKYGDINIRTFRENAHKFSQKFMRKYVDIIFAKISIVITLRHAAGMRSVQSTVVCTAVYAHTGGTDGTCWYKLNGLLSHFSN